MVRLAENNNAFMQPQKWRFTAPSTIFKDMPVLTERYNRRGIISAAYPFSEYRLLEGDWTECLEEAYNPK
jgi:hypothetical protein